jgi:hypothetical protein
MKLTRFIDFEAKPICLRRRSNMYPPIITPDAVTYLFDSLLSSLRHLDYPSKMLVWDNFARFLARQSDPEHVGRVSRSRQISFAVDASDWEKVVAIYQQSKQCGFLSHEDECFQTIDACVACCELGRIEESVQLRDEVRSRFSRVWNEAEGAHVRLRGRLPD